MNWFRWKFVQWRLFDRHGRYRFAADRRPLRSRVIWTFRWYYK